ncbi:MAG: tRNA dihydrouridine synthase DusB, partial [Lachnospiraceae bacterium]|nr:tRNA dihydrouridine synthase DusB [Lachnospiraceae bacterium]
LPFRILCHEFGAGLVSMEMVSAKAILYKNKNTASLMESCPEERPVSLQFFGRDPKIMGDMAKQTEELPFDTFDINMGCPVPKVVNNGEGSALMKEPALAGEIISAMVKAVKKPVTVKIRAGFDEEHKNAVELAKIAEASGAAAVTVHGRTREQYYSGRADYDIIRRVKEAVKIPVFGNGDIKSYEDVCRMQEETGCDGYMIARGARGNPWIFREILAEDETGSKIQRPSCREVKEMIYRQAELMVKYKGEFIAMREMRKHAAWYMTGLPHAAAIRDSVNRVESMKELRELLESYDWT